MHHSYSNVLFWDTLNVTLEHKTSQYFDIEMYAYGLLWSDNMEYEGNIEKIGIKVVFSNAFYYQKLSFDIFTVGNIYM